MSAPLHYGGMESDGQARLTALTDGIDGLAQPVGVADTPDRDPGGPQRLVETWVRMDAGGHHHAVAGIKELLVGAVLFGFHRPDAL